MAASQACDAAQVCHVTNSWACLQKGNLIHAELPPSSGSLNEWLQRHATTITQCVAHRLWKACRGVKFSLTSSCEASKRVKGQAAATVPTDL